MLACSALVGCGSDPARTSALDTSLHFGPFAGYQALGPTHSVSAEFTVPRITARSRPGVAATWIGAQVISPTVRAPFIQVGSIEVRRAGRPDLYFAFWADTAQGFRALPLFLVHPGDSLSASLALSHRRWTVSLSDPASRRRKRFTTTQEANASFQTTLWIQEDPLSLHGHFAPYPQLTGLRFSHLTVDDSAPADADTGTAWMSAGDQLLRPTSLVDDGFTTAVGPGPLSSTARRLLSVAQRFADESARPQAALAAEQAFTGAVVPAARALDAAGEHSIQALQATSWPQRTRPAVTALVRSLRHLLTCTERLARAPGAEYAAAHRRWLAAARAAILAGTRLRIFLGAPRVTPPPATLASLFLG